MTMLAGRERDAGLERSLREAAEQTRAREGELNQQIKRLQSERLSLQNEFEKLQSVWSSQKASMCGVILNLDFRCYSYNNTCCTIRIHFTRTL